MRELYLSKIREGAGRKGAATLAGINYATVWRYGQENPDFLLEVRDAEAEWVHPVYAFWRDIMDDPEIPWKDRLKASENLEKSLGRDQSKDSQVIKHEHEHVIVGGDQLDRVMQLQKDLAERQELESGTIVEAKVLDESDTDEL